MEQFVDNAPTLEFISEDDEAWLSQLSCSLSLHELDEIVLQDKWLDDARDNTHKTSLLEQRQFFYESLTNVQHGVENWGEFTNDNYNPVRTFIRTQRTMQSLGLDAVKIINTHPAAIGLNEDSVRSKVDNFTSLGLDAVKIINTLPAAIGLNEDSVRSKVDNFTSLGLDAVKIINTLPAAIGYNEDSVRSKVDNFTSLGLDAVKIINTLPAAIGYNEDSVRSKVDNFTSLGLDAVKIINTHPAAISYNEDSVRSKVRLINRLTGVLKLNVEAKELIESFPAMLGYSASKLMATARVYADKPIKHQPEKQINSALTIPIELHIIAAALPQAKKDYIAALRKVINRKLSAPERKRAAVYAAQECGEQIGKAALYYLRHKKLK